jgi:hypothetical protein
MDVIKTQTWKKDAAMERCGGSATYSIFLAFMNASISFYNGLVKRREQSPRFWKIKNIEIGVTTRSKFHTSHSVIAMV